MKLIGLLAMYNKQVKFAPYGRWDCRYAPAPYLSRYVINGTNTKQ
jgi:hypothetical protein